MATLSCMPPPVSSAVILTKAVGGNEAAAIFNSVFGSLLGILVTPALLLRLVKDAIFNECLKSFHVPQVGVTATVSSGSLMIQLLTTVLVPLILGQVARHTILSGSRILRSNLLSTVSQLALLLIIFTTFCDAFMSKPDVVNLTGQQSDWSPTHLTLVILFGTTPLTCIIDEISIDICVSVILLQSGLMMTLYYLTFIVLRSHFTREDGSCIIFCGVHKSLTLGMIILH